jgi:hypothetical protein
VADLLWGGTSLEVNPFNDRIGFEQEQAFGNSDFEHGTVITWPHHDGIICRQRTRQTANQLKLIHHN